MVNILVVALSFGLTHHEPSTVNLRLRDNVLHVIDQIKMIGATPLVVCQWEIALGMDPAEIIEIVPPKISSYLSSDDVLAVAFEVAANHNVSEIVAVCQPFLHRSLVEHAITRAGYTPRRFAVDPVGFDARSIQPWTRSRLALLRYSVMRMFGRGGTLAVVPIQMRQLSTTPQAEWPFQPDVPAQ